MRRPRGKRVRNGTVPIASGNGKEILCSAPVCSSFIEFDTAACDCGWFGWGQGKDPYCVYVCDLDACGKHSIYVSSAAGYDPDYYARRCDYVRQCCHPRT